MCHFTHPMFSLFSFLFTGLSEADAAAIAEAAGAMPAGAGGHSALAGSSGRVSLGVHNFVIYIA